MVCYSLEATRVERQSMKSDEKVAQTADNRSGFESSGTERWLKREAVQIVAQLPDDQAQALRVLEYARRLVVGFLAEHPHAGGREDGRDLKIVG
jgi:hypothetical protein